MTYYYSGRSGDSFTDATIHADADCCPDPTRPIAEASVDEDTATLCAECVPLDNDSDSGGGITKTGGDAENAELVNADDKSDRLLIESGVCPWCDDYEGDHVAQHAASAHPEPWTEYTD